MRALTADERAVSHLLAQMGVPGTCQLAVGRMIATRYIPQLADVVGFFGDTRLVVAAHRPAQEVHTQAQEVLELRHGIEHATLQTESGPTRQCQLDW